MNFYLSCLWAGRDTYFSLLCVFTHTHTFCSLLCVFTNTLRHTPVLYFFLHHNFFIPAVVCVCVCVFVCPSVLSVSDWLWMKLNLYCGILRSLLLLALNEWKKTKSGSVNRFSETHTPTYTQVQTEVTQNKDGGCFLATENEGGPGHQIFLRSDSFYGTLEQREGRGAWCRTVCVCVCVCVYACVFMPEQMCVCTLAHVWCVVWTMYRSVCVCVCVHK